MHAFSHLILFILFQQHLAQTSSPAVMWLSYLCTMNPVLSKQHPRLCILCPFWSSAVCSVLQWLFSSSWDSPSFITSPCAVITLMFIQRSSRPRRAAPVSCLKTQQSAKWLSVVFFPFYYLQSCWIYFPSALPLHAITLLLRLCSCCLSQPAVSFPSPHVGWIMVISEKF